MQKISIDNLKNKILNIFEDLTSQYAAKYNIKIENDLQYKNIVYNNDLSDEEFVRISFDYIQKHDITNEIIELLCTKLENLFRFLDFKNLDTDCQNFCLSKKWENKKDKGIPNTFKFCPYILADYLILCVNNYNLTLNNFITNNFNLTNQIILNNNDKYLIISELTTLLLLKYKYHFNINNIIIYIDSEFENWIYKFIGIKNKNIRKISNWKNINNEIYKMNFNKIIMNPPYVKNLHLTILEQALNNLLHDGTCINLSPVRWLQDIFAISKKNSDFKRFSDSIRTHIKNINVINKLIAQQYFPGTVMGADLGIYICTTKKENFNFDKLYDPICTKILNTLTEKPIFEKDKKDGYRVRIPKFACNGGSGNRKPTLGTFGKCLYFYNGKKDGKPWYDFYNKNQNTKKTDTITVSIKFNTEIEAQNFCNTYTLFLPKYFTHKAKCDTSVNPNIIFWLGNKINPRTKKIGYLSNWTNEDLYLLCQITKDEQEKIETEINSYNRKKEK